MAKTIGEILIEKLTKNELSKLCSAYDNGQSPSKLVKLVSFKT